MNWISVVAGHGELGNLFENARRDATVRGGRWHDRIACPGILCQLQLHPCTKEKWPQGSDKGGKTENVISFPNGNPYQRRGDKQSANYEFFGPFFKLTRNCSSNDL